MKGQVSPLDEMRVAQEETDIRTNSTLQGGGTKNGFSAECRTSLLKFPNGSLLCQPSAGNIPGQHHKCCAI